MLPLCETSLIFLRSIIFICANDFFFKVIKIRGGGGGALPGGEVVKNPPADAGHAREVGSIPGSRRSPGKENGNPLQYSCLENFGQRSLAGYSPWDHRESNLTE